MWYGVHHKERHEGASRIEALCIKACGYEVIIANNLYWASERHKIKRLEEFMRIDEGEKERFVDEADKILSNYPMGLLTIILSGLCVLPRPEQLI